MCWGDYREGHVLQSHGARDCPAWSRRPSPPCPGAWERCRETSATWRVGSALPKTILHLNLWERFWQNHSASKSINLEHEGEETNWMKSHIAMAWGNTCYSSLRVLLKEAKAAEYKGLKERANLFNSGIIIKSTIALKGSANPGKPK